MTDKSNGFGFDELARQLVQSLPHNLRVLGEDFEHNFKVLLQSGFEKMELVTREEFDIQSAVLERTREKLDAIEARLTDLEHHDTPTAGPTQGGNVASPAADPGSNTTPEQPLN